MSAPRSTSTDDDDRQRIALSDGTTLIADIVVLAQGFLDREPTAEEARLTCSRRQRSGLTYIPPGYTADHRPVRAATRGTVYWSEVSAWRSST